MPDNPNRSHPAGISRRDALRGVFLGALGLAVIPRLAEAKESIQSPQVAETFVPENNYPTFVDEPNSKLNGKSAEPS
jgi:hypothetical protein